MSLILKKASTFPVRIEVDFQTDAGPIKGHFIGHARIRSKDEARAFRERLQDPGDGEALTDAQVLHEMYDRFEGLADEDGAPLEGEAAFEEVLGGQYSVHLCAAVVEHYWAALIGGGTREGNSRPRRGR